MQILIAFWYHFSYKLKVTVKAKVLDKPESTSKTTKIGNTVNLCNITIADNTSSIILALWEQDIERAELGKSYKFERLTVKLFDNVKSLSKPSSGVITQIEDIGPVSINPNRSKMKKP